MGGGRRPGRGGSRLRTASGTRVPARASCARITPHRLSTDHAPPMLRAGARAGARAEVARSGACVVGTFGDGKVEGVVEGVGARVEPLRREGGPRHEVGGGEQRRGRRALEDQQRRP
jgi:hypothetical protein